jgi:hypothetical protein
MIHIPPLKMIALGVVLLILGVILPLLMVLKIFASTFFLNFFSYGCTVSGMFIGMIGAFTYVKERKK